MIEERNALRDYLAPRLAGDDLRAASKLIAAYVKAAVEADRATREGKRSTAAESIASALDKIEQTLATNPFKRGFR